MPLAHKIICKLRPTITLAQMDVEAATKGCMYAKMPLSIQIHAVFYQRSSKWFLIGYESNDDKCRTKSICTNKR